MSAHLWMEIGFSPLADMAISRDVSSGSCGLRKSLGSLSADRSACVPTQFFSLRHSSTGAWRLLDGTKSCG